MTAVCKACNFHLYRLSSIRRYITTDAARSVVQALVTSRLDYCNSLLANLTNTQMKRLKSIQHKAACLVTRTPLREHITPVLKQLHWLPVECRITNKLMVMVYKCMNGTAPAYLTVHQHNTRQVLDPHFTIIFNSIAEKSIIHRGPRICSNIPQPIKECANKKSFNKLLKRHFLMNQE